MNTNKDAQLAPPGSIIATFLEGEGKKIGITTKPTSQDKTKTNSVANVVKNKAPASEVSATVDDDPFLRFTKPSEKKKLFKNNFISGVDFSPFIEKKEEEK